MSNNQVWWKRLLHSLNSNWFRPRKKVEPVDQVDPVDPVPPTPPVTPVTPVTPVNPVNTVTSPFVQASGQSLTIDGQPITIRADTAWLLTENLAGDRGQVCAYLDQRKAQGFNCIMIGCNGAWFNRDVSKPNATLFSRLDATFADAEARGLYLILCPQVVAYDANGKPYCHVPGTQSYAVGTYFAQRYGTQKALAFWMVGGADDRIMAASELVAFALGIRGQDLSHIITYHPRAGKTSLDVTPPGDLHGLILYQSYHVYNAAAQRAALAQMRATGKPFFNCEGPFEGEAGVSIANVVLAAQIAREYPVCGFAYGHTNVWPFNKNWKQVMSAPGLAQWIKATK